MEHLSLRTVERFLERTCEVHAGAAPRPSTLSPESIARYWRDRGLRPGDLVFLGLPNGPGLLSHFFGVLEAGGTPALIAPDAPASRWCELVSILKARGAVSIRSSSGLRDIVRLDSIDGVQIAVFTPTAEPAAQPGEVILMTSGTSGAASGCAFGLEALLLNATRHADSIGQRPGESVLINLPLYFSFTLVAQALATCLRGGTLVISGPPFHAGTYLRILEKHNIDVSSLTPALVRPLLAAKRPLPRTLRLLSVGGGPLPAESVETLLGLLDGSDLYLTYGLSQAGPRVSTNRVERGRPDRFTSVGLPLEGTHVELEELADGSGRKQLIVSSASVMRRRVGLVESRPANELRAPGVLATGDAFEQDADGYLYFRGRLSDFLTRGDTKICLASVRRLAGELPYISRAKTQVINKSDGSCDFRLTLAAMPECPFTAEDYQVQLSRILRRSELPSQVVVVPENELPLEHK